MRSSVCRRVRRGWLEHPERRRKGENDGVNCILGGVDGRVRRGVVCGMSQELSLAGVFHMRIHAVLHC